MKKIIVLLVTAISLSACSSNPKPLKAPCTYESRGGCGQEVALEQGSISN